MACGGFAEEPGAIRLKDDDILGECFESRPVGLDDSNRHVTCLSCFDIRNGSGFSFVRAANDFALSAIFEFLRCRSFHAVDLITEELWGSSLAKCSKGKSSAPRSKSCRGDQAEASTTSGGSS